MKSSTAGSSSTNRDWNSIDYCPLSINKLLLNVSAQSLNGLHAPSWEKKDSKQGETRRRWAGEKGDGLGSAAPTRQLNAPRAWWISNWRLITSEVCWIRVSVMNGRCGAWQISVVTPLHELWADGRQMCACLIQHTGPACYIRVCVLSLKLINMCVVKMGPWHVKNNREEMEPTEEETEGSNGEKRREGRRNNSSCC